jgi:hypothetical protein
VYAWEKTTPNKAVTILQVLEEMRFLELYRLGWICCRRLGMFAGSLDEFCASVQIEPGEEEGEGDDEEQPDPTPAGPSPGPASSSPSPPASPRRSGRTKAGAP